MDCVDIAHPRNVNRIEMIINGINILITPDASLPQSTQIIQKRGVFILLEETNCVYNTDLLDKLT